MALYVDGKFFVVLCVSSIVLGKTGYMHKESYLIKPTCTQHEANEIIACICIYEPDTKTYIFKIPLVIMA